jgi:carboxylesterase type B
MLSCLQNKTQQEILEAHMQFGYFPSIVPIYFAPVIDGTLLPDFPVNLINNQAYNKVPFMSGLTENEGLAFYQTDVNAGMTFNRTYITSNLEELVTNYTYLTGDELTQVTSLIYDEYFGGQIDLDDINATGGGVQEFISDVDFNAGNYEMMTLLHKGDGYPNVYSYVFTYQGQYMEYPGKTTTHGDELLYLFDVAADNGGMLNAADTITSQRMLTLWTNFAKTGDPNPTNASSLIPVTWEPVTSSDSVPYLNIDSNLTMVQTAFRPDRMQFWNEQVIPFIEFYSDISGSVKLFPSIWSVLLLVMLINIQMFLS